MTIFKVCAVMDRAMTAYHKPIFVPARAVARRMFSDIANQADHEIGQHPEDYELHELGEWDEITGEFSAAPPADRLIVRAKDCLNAKG